MPKRIKRIIQIIIRAIQKVLITIFLIILYVVGFGMTYLFIFKKNILFKKHKKGKTFWVKAMGYELDADGSLRQA